MGLIIGALLSVVGVAVEYIAKEPGVLLAGKIVSHSRRVPTFIMS